MKRTISIFLFLLCACAYSLPMLGWGQEGHRIIAKIAYDNLNKKARKQVDKILGNGGIVAWANWPDEIKSDTIFPNSHDWHYQDFENKMTAEEMQYARTHYPTEGGNLFRALDSLETVLKAGQGDKYTLRFLIHLKGDEHCPVHLAHMSDKGGNAVKMKWFGRETNLHSVWDTKLIESQGYSYTEYADMLEKRYSTKGLNKQILDAEDWTVAWRTKGLTDCIYKYQETWDGNTYHYIYHMKEYMEFQLYIAGIRLAGLLNSIYK